jgi:hypothetical protein
MGRAPNLRLVPNVGMCDIFLKEVQLRFEKHENLKIEEGALLLTFDLLIPPSV